LNSRRSIRKASGYCDDEEKLLIWRKRSKKIEAIASEEEVKERRKLCKTRIRCGGGRSTGKASRRGKKGILKK